MENNYLCMTQRARHPFFIESIGINIYSAEELCYYLYHYVYLIDETVINGRLCTWIGEELGMTRTGNQMARALEHNEGSTAFFTPLFQECRYLSEEETRKVLEKIAGMQVEPEDVRHKQKADYLLRFELYISAIGEYEKILEHKNEGRLGRQFYAEVLEQIAAAYARLFRFEDAAAYLWEAYQLTQSRVLYEKYLKILPLFLSRQRYEQKLTEIGADLQEAKYFREETESILLEGLQMKKREDIQKESAEECLEKRKNSYIRNTTGAR